MKATLKIMLMVVAMDIVMMFGKEQQENLKQWQMKNNRRRWSAQVWLRQRMLVQRSATLPRQEGRRGEESSDGLPSFHGGLLTGTPGNKTNGSLLLDRLPTKLSLHEVDLHTSDSSLSLFLR